jgi:hypothetical protein
LALLNGTPYRLEGEEVNDPDSENELPHSAALSQAHLLVKIIIIIY